MRTMQVIQSVRSQRIGNRRFHFVHLIRLNFSLVLLLFASVLSAFAVVYVKDLNRRLFIDYQVLQQVRQQYEVEWNKLLLEQSTWSTQARIQTLAQTQLNMIYPKQKNIVIIKE